MARGLRLARWSVGVCRGRQAGIVVALPLVIIVISHILPTTVSGLLHSPAGRGQVRTRRCCGDVGDDLFGRSSNR
ncbi:hypothetical protein PR202_ga11631 [Eleusine coracana subsp. coracana]|uniref:Uncharacterized protein n=1 Tax=Eleusine coracana subsp. coracana TaxID=191504 RepID=A0AAV5CA25_ELECO|nr:hypothetical protein PR202_ga11631 [Eleusine coracana subsp. coracana]